MLAALLLNPVIPPEPAPPQHARGGGSGPRRRPNEPVIWCDDERLRCQDELSAFKAKPEDEQKAIVAEAMEAIKAAPQAEHIIDAQEVVADLDGLADIMCQVECLNMLLLAYFRLKFENRRQDDIAAMLLLGIL